MILVYKNTEPEMREYIKAVKTAHPSGIEIHTAEYMHVTAKRKTMYVLIYTVKRNSNG